MAPLVLYILASSPNDPPTSAEGSPQVIGGQPEIMIFQPIHAGLKTAKSSLVGPHRGTALVEKWR